MLETKEKRNFGVRYSIAIVHGKEGSGPHSGELLHPYLIFGPGLAVIRYNPREANEWLSFSHEYACFRACCMASQPLISA